MLYAATWGLRDMAKEDQEEDARVRQHVSKILARLTAFKDRLRAQKKISQGGSPDTAVEVNREDDDPGSIDDVEPPA